MAWTRRFSVISGRMNWRCTVIPIQTGICQEAKYTPTAKAMVCLCTAPEGGSEKDVTRGAWGVQRFPLNTFFHSSASLSSSVLTMSQSDLATIP
ncbi:hypothetical protein PAXRUDRAFT_831322, partial [Paxillus rubicundulus Ve08.2h10]